MVSWQVPYLAEGCRPDFPTLIMASEVTRTVAPFWHLFKSDSNNGPSPGNLNLARNGVTSVQVSHLWFPGRCYISGQRLQGLIDFLTSIMTSEVIQIVVPFWPPAFIESDSNNGLHRAILNCKHVSARKLF